MRSNPDPFASRPALGRMIEDLPSSVKYELEAHFQLIDAPAGTTLVRAGEHTNVCFFVLRGVLGKFADDGAFSDILLPDDIYYPTETDDDGLSRSTVHAFSGAMLFAVSLPKFEALKRNHSELQALERAALKYEMLQRSERLDRLHTMDARQRYAYLLERYPGAEAEIPAEHIAAWLDIDTASLNRIRSTDSKLH